MDDIIFADDIVGVFVSDCNEPDDESSEGGSKS